MNEFRKRGRTHFMLPTTDSLQLQKHTQVQSEGMENYISHKWKQKKSRDSYTYISQNRLLVKTCNKRQRRSLYNDKGVNSSRGYNNYKYICM